MPLASPDISDTRGAHGLHHVQEGGHYGRQPDGLGRNSRGPICEGPLECGPPVVSYKFSGAVSDVPLNETFPSVSHGPSCPGEDGQYNDGGVHQPSRGAALPSVVHAGTQTDPVELHSALAPTTVEGPAITGGTLFHPHPERMALWVILSAVGLSQRVISTIQSALASSTRSLCDCKWRVFEGWCHRNGHIPFQWPVGVILSFLQDLRDKRKALSTIKVYLAAITACHVGFGKQTASQHPLVCRFMKGA